MGSPPAFCTRAGVAKRDPRSEGLGPGTEKNFAGRTFFTFFMAFIAFMAFIILKRLTADSRLLVVGAKKLENV